jgi:hypothetical protein
MKLFILIGIKKLMLIFLLYIHSFCIFLALETDSIIGGVTCGVVSIYEKIKISLAINKE